MADWAALGVDVRGRVSGEVKTLCPRCSHTRSNTRDRCLSVNLDEGLWHCHHCDWSGTVNERDGYGSRPRPAPPKPYARPDYEPVDGALHPAAVEWLTSRGITEAVWIRNRIGYLQNAIAFPYYRGGDVVNIKHRGRGKKFWMVADAELTLYGLNDIAPGEPLVWVEGEMDKLAVDVAGVTACVSIPNGAPAPGSRDYARHFAYLEPLRSTLDGAARHIIAVDNDAPGRTLADELIRRLGPERCWSVTWPAGCKDANDVLLQHGADGLARALQAARPVPMAGLFEVADLHDAVYDLYEHGMDGGEDPGSAKLAPYYKVKPGLWTLVTGIPGHGKSALLDWIMVNLARRVGWQFAICSPENQPLARHIGQLAQIWSGRPFGPGPQRRMTPEELGEALALLHEHFLFLLPEDDEGYTVDGILRLARAAVYRRGIRGFVIDPWNELEHTRPAGMSETEHTSQVLTKIRRFARAHGVHVWVVAHPTKLIKDAKGTYPVPTPYDVSGSAHFRNKADMALSVWRDVNDERAATEVHIQKVRFRESGQIGMVELFYDAVTGRYVDFGPVTHHYDRDPWEE